jgi:hypothetical protein
MNPFRGTFTVKPHHWRRWAEIRAAATPGHSCGVPAFLDALIGLERVNWVEWKDGAGGEWGFYWPIGAKPPRSMPEHLYATWLATEIERAVAQRASLSPDLRRH